MWLCCCCANLFFLPQRTQSFNAKIRKGYEQVAEHFGCPSPDCSGILLLASLASKRYSGKLEIAPKKKQKKRTNFKSLSLILLE